VRVKVVAYNLIEEEFLSGKITYREESLISVRKVNVIFNDNYYLLEEDFKIFLSITEKQRYRPITRVELEPLTLQLNDFLEQLNLENKLFKDIAKDLIILPKEKNFNLYGDLIKYNE